MKIKVFSIETKHRLSKHAEWNEKKQILMVILALAVWLGAPIGVAEAEKKPAGGSAPFALAAARLGLLVGTGKRCGTTGHDKRVNDFKPLMRSARERHRRGG